MVNGRDDLDEVAAEEDRVMDRDLPAAVMLPLPLPLQLAVLTQLSFPLSLPARRRSPAPFPMAGWAGVEPRTGLTFERMLPQ